MARLPLVLAAALLAVATPSTARTADDPTEPPADFDFELALTANDLDAITMDILKRYPILSASSGIKFSRGSRRFPTGERAQVLFFPHSETGGVKNALQAYCGRDTPDSPWSCPDVEVRRYVKLDTQDFEVRVVGDIDLDGVLALTEATRSLAASAFPNSAADTVMIIVAVDDGYFVGWGSEAGRKAVSIQAHLRAGGNAANAADWEVAMLTEE